MAIRGQVYEGALEPVWFGDREVWSVTGVIEGARRRVAEVPSSWVHGEVSDLRVQANLPMAYLTLKDPQNGYTVSCVMGRTRYESLGVDLKDGDQIQVYGRADMYAPRGQFQLRLQTIEHTGRGLLMQRLDELREKLAAEGLFAADRKRALPFLPRRVGLITGKGAAAEGDFIRNIERRFPPVKLVVCHTLVQGDKAPPLIVGAIRTMQRIDDVDVIVLARGGGAFEDFLAFSDERVLRAIAACPKPVVSAIGHDKDQPLSDLVADLRVSTPTAAAREVVPDYASLVARLEREHAGLRRRMQGRVDNQVRHQSLLAARLASHAPHRLVEERLQFIDELAMRARRCVRAKITAAAQAHANRTSNLRSRIRQRVGACDARQRELAGRLRSLSPQRTLERGYSIVQLAGTATIVRDPAQAPAGTSLSLRLAGGGLAATSSGEAPAEAP